ncbi:hypothetical protein GCM10023219_10230 [Stakelama sediminis]|uniref:Flippase-like domain-containing protein n=1 Tax=Stakelama sediminis TaxID=463200 RepID=A0A840YW26_9SPHN|nr:hypothetical protein [Stakelama sediminis]MBB5717746.1 hypothetical protein [Stakelama sediminis]
MTVSGSQTDISDTPVKPIPFGSDIAGLEPVEKIRRRWPLWLGYALSILMVIGLARELFDDGLTGLTRMVPVNPLFYAFFFAAYIAPPAFDFLIFRRLWKLPFSGFGALVRKRIANDVIIGYSGDVYFYVWARERLKMVVAPFGAIKDVTILSGIAGNGITLLMAAFALPLGLGLLTPYQFRVFIGSVAIVLATSLPFLIFSRRVFSLPRGQLWWIFVMHCARAVFGMAMLALAWHFAMPMVAVGWWAFLVAARLLVSRLPLVPNKDLLFANIAIMLIGEGKALSNLIAFTAASTLLLHIVLAGAFALHALLEKKN